MIKLEKLFNTFIKRMKGDGGRRIKINVACRVNNFFELDCDSSHDMHG